jgi:ABC-type transport system involved in multi-copper enzyme maturation permease subunit
MEKRKGKPFLEILSSAIHEDYRFPLLEVFAFLYALGTFALASFGSILTSQGVASGEAVAYQVTTSLLGVPLLIFVILIFKNIAYGLGSDLEKGIVQTYFSYPLKRWRILTAKLLSAIGISVVLFLGIQIAALYILAPDIVLPHFGTVLLTYIAGLSYPLIITAILLLLTMIFKRGSLTLVIGIILYFALSIVSGIVFFIAYATQSTLLLQVFSVLSPQTVLQQYYSPGAVFLTAFWTPTFSEVLLSVGASYAIAAVLFFIGYYYFSRRLSL